ncbi:MAG: twin-arginine translocase TatA/TatE family subunit [Chloroflexi bacterium]|nr:twin-arginine translocase TatA/TatE family subunit [Chloroflexota bacterium]
MPHLGTMELVIILVIVMLVFGAGKLSSIGGALGKGIKEFKQATKEIEGASEDVKAAADEVNE